MRTKSQAMRPEDFNAGCAAETAGAIHPEGMKEGSRGSKRSETPGSSATRLRIPEGCQRTGHTRCCAQLLMLALSLGLLLVPIIAHGRPQADPAPESGPHSAFRTLHSALAESTAYFQALLLQDQARYRREPANPQAATEFGCACFRLAEYATNQAQRAQLAEQGIAACRQALALGTNSAPAHYYLGVNLGQLARTKGFGALKLVSQMRQEFNLARSLDGRVDFAGPDRNLGQIYRDAPALISIGNRALAEQHLRRAVLLAPEFPDNYLELIEGCLKWGERDQARRQLAALEAAWPTARARLAGSAWAGSWADWTDQVRRFKKKAGEPQPALEAPRQRK